MTDDTWSSASRQHFIDTGHYLPAEDTVTTAQLDYLRGITAENRVSYPDRWKMAVERNVVLDIYVPTTAAGRYNIIEGSAIVGLPIEGNPDRVLVYFEGGKFVSMTFDEKLRHAAGRMVCRYPTIATAVLNAGGLARVGTYDVATSGADITDQTALDAWRTT